LKQNQNVVACFPATKIYIFCPAGYATGGPEALHQLGAQLNLLGFDAYMHYYATPDSGDVLNYQKYNVPIADVLENSERHLMILPETHLQPLFDADKNRIRKVIWWLSVVNYHITQQSIIDGLKHKKFFKLRAYFGRFNIASFKKLRRMGVINISHSYYSQVHLEEHGIKPVGRISDYMNSAFFDQVNETTAKENLVIYNPTKNDAFLDEIMSLTPTLTWVPIKNMTPSQVANTMNRAKLYIDFGFHPGKERMPREACIMRCCMIVGKSGSAAYKEDMPIPEKYRFDKTKELIPQIIHRVKECLNNYDTLISDFSPYRQALYLEERQFEKDIQKVFVKT